MCIVAATVTESDVFVYLVRCFPCSMLVVNKGSPESCGVWGTVLHNWLNLGSRLIFPVLLATLVSEVGLACTRG